MIVWMVWDNRDKCHYRLRWGDEVWWSERYVNPKQGWVATGTKGQDTNIYKFADGRYDTLLVELKHDSLEK